MQCHRNSKRNHHCTSDAVSGRGPPHHHSSEFVLRIVFAILIVCAAVVTSVLPSHGGELPPEHATLYVQLSLLNSNGALRKIAKTGPLAVQAICLASPSNGCNKTVLNKQINGAYRGNNRFKARVISENPDIKFIHIGASGLANKRRELSASYLGGFNDSDDLDCQLYYSIKENAIEKVVIVVSLDSPELKQRFCLASQLFHGLGLALPYGLPFSKLWNKPPDGMNAFTDEFVSGLTKSYIILAYIHMCPDIKPGMKAPDIRRLLVESSRCLDGIKLVPEQINGFKRDYG
jgi:hypothetical protein